MCSQYASRDQFTDALTPSSKYQRPLSPTPTASPIGTARSNRCWDRMDNVRCRLVARKPWKHGVRYEFTTLYTCRHTRRSTTVRTSERTSQITASAHNDLISCKVHSAVFSPSLACSLSLSLSRLVSTCSTKRYMSSQYTDQHAVLAKLRTKVMYAAARITGTCWYLPNGSGPANQNPYTVARV
jgi:hypothetical protein